MSGGLCALFEGFEFSRFLRFSICGFVSGKITKGLGRKKKIGQIVKLFAVDLDASQSAEILE